MRRCLQSLLCALALASPLACAIAQQPAAAPVQPAAAATRADSPPDLVAPALPQLDESAARRNVTQPGNNAPFWRGVKESGSQPGTVNLPGAEMGVLMQSVVDYPFAPATNSGEAWRIVRNQWIIPYGSALLVIVLLAIAIFYFTRGPLGGHEVNTGRKIERFTPFERAAHWSNATAFVVLAVSGLVMAFGKFLLLPMIGSTLVGGLTYLLKTAHNFAGPLFAVSLLVVIATFIKDNFPQRGDLQWLLRGGGMFGGAEPPSNRFNAGEKLLFWGGVLLLGLTVVASGLFLDKLLPGFVFTRGEMQIAHMVHAAAAVAVMCAFMGHIYIGTLGMKGAYSAMRTGYVDEAWAQEHHPYWADDVRAGRVPAQRSQPPPPPDTAPLARQI